MKLEQFDDITFRRVYRSNALVLGWQSGHWWTNSGCRIEALKPLVDAGLMEQDGRLFRFTQAGVDYAKVTA